MAIFNSNNQKPNPTEEGLLNFSQLIEKVALILAGIIGIVGVISAISAAATIWDVREEIDFLGFLITQTHTNLQRRRICCIAFLAFADGIFGSLLERMADIVENDRPCVVLNVRRFPENNFDAFVDKPLVTVELNVDKVGDFLNFFDLCEVHPGIITELLIMGADCFRVNLLGHALSSPFNIL